MKNNAWILIGLFWALGMVMFVSLLYPIMMGQEITPKRILIDVVVYLFAGLIFGFVIYRFALKKSKA
jgi:ABC-type antimicrobial peptide transport system permease subunit